MSHESSSDGYVNASALCSRAGRTWSSYRQNLNTQRFLKEAGGSIGVAVETLTRHDTHKDVKNRHTWVHPRVAEHLAQWLLRKPPATSSRGLVYAVTSPVLHAIKVGMWRGTERSLRQRYITPYGPEVQLLCVAVLDAAQTENSLHCILSPFSLGGELFEKQCLKLVRELLRQL